MFAGYDSGLNVGLQIQDTISAQFCPATGCASPNPPALTTWSNASNSGSPHVKRVFSPSVVEGSFIYLAGGSTDTAGTTATQSVERTVS